VRFTATSPAVGALAILAGLAALTVSPRPCIAQAEDGQRLAVVRAGKIITNAGEEIRDGLVVIEDGKITNVGRKLDVPFNARVIDARDRVVMPGLINARSRYGLSRYNRSGVHGNLSVADEYFPPPGTYDDLLDAGYTTLALIPDGSGIPGRALVVRTAGPESQRTLLSPAYLRVTNDKRTFRGALEKARKEIEKVEKARKEFEKKQAELKKKQEQEKKKEPEKKEKPDQKGSETQPATQPAKQPAFKPPPIDPAHQALVDLIQEKPDIFALIELGSASDYLHMRDVLEEHEIAHHFYARNHSRSDLEYVVEKMGQRKEQIILQPLIGRVPHSAERLHLVGRFTAAGCEVSLTPLNDSATEHGRIFVRIAELVREGWPREEALKSVTLYPARLLGLEERLGTIEKDRDADLIFLDADPLDPTARIREVMIAGEMVHRVEDFE
jgi:hypothetical protein